MPRPISIGGTVPSLHGERRAGGLPSGGPGVVPHRVPRADARAGTGLARHPEGGEHAPDGPDRERVLPLDRKSTRLNSSHVEISYAVFCLKKKKKNKQHTQQTTRNRLDSSLDQQR